MAVQTHPLTHADLQRLRETRNERLELIEGELFVTPSPTGLHQLVVMRLSSILERTIVDAGRGMALPAPFDIVLDDETILQPDLFVLLRDDPQFILEHAQYKGPPSLAIEVISPSTASHDRRRKRDLFARYGAPEYWLVDPDRRSVTVFSDLRDGRYQSEHTTSDVATAVTIPGLSVDLVRLFRPVPGF